MVFVRDTTAEVERRERIALLNLVADKTTARSSSPIASCRSSIPTPRSPECSDTHLKKHKDGRRASCLPADSPIRKTLPKLRRRIYDDSGAEEEILAYDKNGDEIWVSAMVKPFRNARGRVKYIFALLTDISENKQLSRCSN